MAGLCCRGDVLGTRTGHREVQAAGIKEGLCQAQTRSNPVVVFLGLAIGSRSCHPREMEAMRGASRLQERFHIINEKVDAMPFRASSITVGRRITAENMCFDPATGKFCENLSSQKTSTSCYQKPGIHR